MGHKLAGVAGLEPTHDGVKVRCLTAWLYPLVYIDLKKLASPQRFEPRTQGLEGRCSIHLSYETALLERMHSTELTLSAWKADFIPCNHIRIIGAKDEIRARGPRLGKAMLYP